MMKSRFFLYVHPFCIAVSPALYVWSINYGEVGSDKALITIAALLVFSLLTLGILYVVLGSASRSAIATSAILFITLYFGYIFETLFVIDVILPWRWSVPLSLGAIALVLVVIYRTSKNFVAAHQILSVSTATFVLISVFQLGNEFRTQQVAVETEKPTFVANGDEEELRDIYYIVLDGYSSPQLVKDVFGYAGIDEFTSFLREEDFFVASQSRSNYAATRLSLPSSLNMQLLDSPKHVKKYDLMFEDHLVKDFLKARGYTFIHMGSNSFTYYNRYADENYNVGTLSPYQQFIWTQTLLYPLTTYGAKYVSADVFETLGGFDAREMEWERVHFQLDTLAQISSQHDEPIFVFAHFNPPKGSVFDPEGNLMTEAEASSKTRAELYVAQIQFINSEMKELVAKLKNDSERDPVIIIQGDHGYKFITDNAFNDPAALAETIPASVSVPELLVSQDEYSFPIFNAYYFPGAEEGVLYDNISPVNSFRVLFNTYFDEDFALIEDTSYIPDRHHGTEFVPFDSYTSEQ